MLTAPSVRGPVYGEGVLLPQAVFVNHKNISEGKKCQNYLGKAKEPKNDEVKCAYQAMWAGWGQRLVEPKDKGRNQVMLL